MNAEAIELTRQFAEVTRSTPLHTIASAIIDAAKVDDNGELTPESVEALDALNLTLTQKVEAYHYVYVELTEQSAASKSIAAYYEQRAHAPKAAAERLKERLQAEMDRLGTKKIATPTCRACIERTNPRVTLVPGAFIPPEYERVLQPEPDKGKMMRAMKAGQELPFAKLEETRHLRFR